MSYEGVRKYHDAVTGIDETLVDPYKTLSVEGDEHSVSVGRLMPGTVYSFNISATFSDGFSSPPANIHAETTADGQTHLVLLSSLPFYDSDDTFRRHYKKDYFQQAFQPT